MTQDVSSVAWPVTQLAEQSGWRIEKQKRKEAAYRPVAKSSRQVARERRSSHLSAPWIFINIQESLLLIE